MGRRTSRTATRNKRIAEEALANLVADADADPRDIHVRHARANPNGRYQKTLKAKTPNQKLFMDVIETSDVAYGVGPAGTGKTFIAVRKALQMLGTNRINKIVLSRPAKEAAGESLGYLKGGMEEKLHPYMMPIYDILSDTLGPATLGAMLGNGTIELCPLAFMRGRTFNQALIILDEMQNATTDQIKMALTRIGEGSRAIVTGDPGQSDLDPKLSGLMPTARALRSAPGVGFVQFTREDIVRSPIVSTILEYLGE